MDWASLGVDTVIVGVIVALVQMLKGLVGDKFVPWLGFVIAAVLSAVYGAVKAGFADPALLVKMAFTYAAAAAWLFSIAAKSANLLSTKGK